MSTGSPARRELADRLRELREAANLSTTGLAVNVGWSQSKVSKIENGRTKPAVADVEAWLTATTAPAEVRDELLDMAESIQVASIIWDRSLAGGREAHQRALGDLLTQATQVRVFQSALIPGLLQTAEYMRRAFNLLDVFNLGDTAKAIAARIERQAALYQPDKRLEFVITEAALRYRPGSPDVLLAQYDRLLSVWTLPSVTIGIIPQQAETTAVQLHPFVIHDLPDEQALVTIETYSRELRMTDPEEVALYQRMYQGLRVDAVFGEPARDLLVALRNSA